jgi:hypothetical protein
MPTKHPEFKKYQPPKFETQAIEELKNLIDELEDNQIKLDDDMDDPEMMIDDVLWDIKQILMEEYGI